jgi:hypothetical protein
MKWRQRQKTKEKEPRMDAFHSCTIFFRGSVVISSLDINFFLVTSPDTPGFRLHIFWTFVPIFCISIWISLINLTSIDHVNPKTMKFVFVASPLSTQHWGMRPKTGGPWIRIMRPPRTTFLFYSLFSFLNHRHEFYRTFKTVWKTHRVSYIGNRNCLVTFGKRLCSPSFCTMANNDVWLAGIWKRLSLKQHGKMLHCVNVL